MDMTTGARPKGRRENQPLTRLVVEAMAGRSGVDVVGDRDYRGVPVIGAWSWLPEYGFGVITKVDRAEGSSRWRSSKPLFGACSRCGSLRSRCSVAP